MVRRWAWTGKPRPGPVDSRPALPYHGGIVAESDDLSLLLTAWSDGDAAARDDVLAAAYQDLRRIARNRMRGDPAGASLQTTGLVHEAYLRLSAQNRVRWENREQFFALAARLMRRILVERWRAKAAQKRGGGAQPAEAGGEAAAGVGGALLDDLDRGLEPDSGLDAIALDRALERLEQQDALQARIVQLRFFADLTVEETAEAEGISPATVKREWAMARAWLRRELDGGP